MSEARARGLLDSQGALTRLGETTLFGEWLEIEQKVDDAELRAKGIWTNEQRERDRRAGVSEKYRLADDERLLRAYYPDDVKRENERENLLKAEGGTAQSPSIPHDCTDQR